MSGGSYDFPHLEHVGSVDYGETPLCQFVDENEIGVLVIGGVSLISNPVFSAIGVAWYVGSGTCILDDWLSEQDYGCTNVTIEIYKRVGNLPLIEDDLLDNIIAPTRFGVPVCNGSVVASAEQLAKDLDPYVTPIVDLVAKEYIDLGESIFSGPDIVL
ncbi:hypothetical protein [Haloarchaeobius sp. TZWWS8]|uniref:hypothetical protein n=1 Tax=Haloarchaeobius sp. TZWWS8 TaxID=3446121 RepID=UPI003EC03E05